MNSRKNCRCLNAVSAGSLDNHDRHSARSLRSPSVRRRYAPRSSVLHASIDATATTGSATSSEKTGWHVNHKCVERIWRTEGLKVPRKQPKRRRLWLNDGSCIRLRPEHKNHVWSYDFVTDRTTDGRAFRMLTILDEYSRECLAIRVGRKMTSYNVIEQLADLMVERGTPDHIRSDNGPEFTADIIRGWLGRLGVKTLFIEPGSPWENGYIESFNGKLRDELLKGEVFDTLLEAKVIVERWRKEYNTERSHSSLGYRPPAPETFLPIQANQLDLKRDIYQIQAGTP